MYTAQQQKARALYAVKRFCQKGCITEQVMSIRHSTAFVVGPKDVFMKEEKMTAQYATNMKCVIDIDN